MTDGDYLTAEGDVGVAAVAVLAPVLLAPLPALSLRRRGGRVWAQNECFNEINRHLNHEVWLQFIQL